MHIIPITSCPSYPLWRLNKLPNETKTKLRPESSGLYLMQGDPKRSGTVLAAGVETCEQFLSIAPTAPPFLETQTTHLVSRPLSC